MKGLIKILGAFIKSNSSTILTVTGIAGMAVACGLSAKAYSKTQKEIEDLEEELSEEEEPTKPTFKQKMSRTWKHWVWPVLAFFTSALCIVSASNILLRQKAMWISAYKAAETAAMEFKETAKDVVGPETIKKIEETRQQKKVESVMDELYKDNTMPETDILITGEGQELIYDTICGTLYYGSRNKSIEHINEINNLMNSERYMTLNELRIELKLPSVTIGDIVGWNVDRHGLIHAEFYPIERNGKLCWSTVYTVYPDSSYKDY